MATRTRIRHRVTLAAGRCGSTVLGGSVRAAAACRRAAKLSLLSVVLGAALLLCAPAMAYLPPGGGWEYMGQQDFLHIYGVDFADATHGWIVGDDYDATHTPTRFGAIAVTSDGGSTWTRQGAGTTHVLAAVAATGTMHACAVGDSGAIVTTANGGITWTPRLSGTSARLNSVSFADLLHGCAVGEGGMILTTANGGTSWTPRLSGTTADLMGVSFPPGDATHGWAVGGSYSGGYTSVILVTANGGVTWTPQLADVPNELIGVCFPDAAHGWTVTFDGVLYSTANGGATWGHKQFTKNSNHPAGLDFPDATHGWIVGGTENKPWGTMIWATANGGSTWKLQNKGGGPEVGMNAIAFPDVMHGYAVGESGTIMRTLTGGKPPVTLKLKGLKRRAMVRRHRLTATGVVTPAGVAGDRVRVTLQMRRGGHWKTAKAVWRTQKSTGAYVWKYRPRGKGAYRIKAAVRATADHPAAVTKWSSFRVK